MTTEDKNTNSEFVLPYDPTMFIVHKTGEVGVSESMKIEPVKVKKIDFKVGDKTMEIVEWQSKKYGSDDTIFQVEPSEEDDNKYMANIFMEPHGTKLMGFGKTIVEALNDASNEALEFWKEWDEAKK